MTTDTDTDPHDLAGLVRLSGDGRITYFPRDLPSEIIRDTWSIELSLRPVFAADEYDPGTWSPGEYPGAEPITTSIRMERVELPATGPAGLAGRTLTFPLNPEDGFIDASVYLMSTHFPVDVTAIRFGEYDGTHLHARLAQTIAFSDASDLDDLPLPEQRVRLRWELWTPR